MSLLNQLLNRGVFASKCKTCLNLAISRMKLLQNKRDMQLKHMRKEIAQFLQAGQEAIARIRVEHVIREQNIWAAYEILALFCEFVLARVPILEIQRECPTELREAVSSIIFAAPRCSEVPDLLHIKNLFTTKYGKQFAMAASELTPDSGVNRTIIEKLSPAAPLAEVKLKVLKEIAREYNVDWDSSFTEAEFSKKHEDLLSGSKQVCRESAVSEVPSTKSSHNPPFSYETRSTVHANPEQASKQHQANHRPLMGTCEIKSSSIAYDSVVPTGKKHEMLPQTSDVLEKARAAIASAERASAAARAAAQLVNVNFGSLKIQGKSL